jgi:hypothetical protein
VTVQELIDSLRAMPRSAEVWVEIAGVIVDGTSMTVGDVAESIRLDDSGDVVIHGEG